MKKYIFIAGALLLIVAAAMAFGPARDNMAKAGQQHNQSQGQSASDTTAEPQKTTSVTIDDFAFNPANIVVKKGSTVTWTNNDTAKHNVAFTSGSLSGTEGPLMAQGETYTHTFDEAGTFDYKCTPHPFMQASVTVEE